MPPGQLLQLKSRNQTELWSESFANDNPLPKPFQRQFETQSLLYCMEIPVSFASAPNAGGVAERLNATVLKTVVG